MSKYIYGGSEERKMHNFLSCLTRVFPSNLEKVPERDQGKRNDAIVRAIAQRNAEGSVILGKGNILTQKDKERVFAELDLD